MTSTSKWTLLCVVVAMLALPAVLGGCKSKAGARTAPSYSGSYGGGTAASPGVAAIPQQPGYADEYGTTGYPPPAPPLADATAADQAAIDAARDAAEIERQQNADLKRQLAAERRALEETENKVREMEDRITQLETPPAGPVHEVDMSIPAKDATDRLIEDLRARSISDVLRDGDMVVVRVTNSFKAGSDKLKGDVQLMTTLNATADALQRCNGASVAVVGHSDGDPIRKSGWPDNDALSLARAQRVAKVLADNGVDSNRISIDGRGFREPLVNPEVGRADKARNRRVEIMIRP